MVLAIFGVAEVNKLANFEEIVFDVLHAARRPVLDKVVHHIQSLKDAAVFFGLAAKFGPQVLHYRVVVLPVVGVVSQNLQLCVADRPVLITRGFFENLFVFRLLKD